MEELQAVIKCVCDLQNLLKLFSSVFKGQKEPKTYLQHDRMTKTEPCRSTSKYKSLFTQPPKLPHSIPCLVGAFLKPESRILRIHAKGPKNGL